MTKRTRTPAKLLVEPVRSLGDLLRKARHDERYRKLLFVAAENLGGGSDCIEEAYRWLVMNAQETDEEGVVDEVNFCRDLI